MKHSICYIKKIRVLINVRYKLYSLFLLYKIIVFSMTVIFLRHFRSCIFFKVVT